MKRVGIIRGRFDPINRNDVSIAMRYLKEERLDKVFFCIDQESKRTMKDRKRMVKLALAPYRKLALFDKPNLPHDLIVFPIEDAGLDLGLAVDGFAESTFHCLPKPVARYAIDHALYFDCIVKAEVSGKRFLHIRSMANLAAEMAEKHGVSASKALVAGYLHDITKEWSEARHRRIVETYFPQYANENIQMLHQYTARWVACKRFLIRDHEILDAIGYHVNGDDPKPLSRIVYCADKIEDTRPFDNAYLKKCCFEDLEKGYEEVKRVQLDYLRSKGELND